VNPLLSVTYYLNDPHFIKTAWVAKTQKNNLIEIIPTKTELNMFHDNGKDVLIIFDKIMIL